MATNLKKTSISFEDAHSAILASCMMLLQGTYATGVIANSFPYSHMYLPWGSNPITDRLLSSACFDIVHDGAAFTRIEKVQILSQWPESVQNLRVCLVGEKRDENCCRCEKCIRTILEFRVLGLGLPACFEHDVSNIQIVRLNFTPPGRIYYYSSILAAAKENHISASWVQTLKWAYLYNQLKLNLILRLRQNNWLRQKVKSSKTCG
jgi:hypothetical protein